MSDGFSQGSTRSKRISAAESSVTDEDSFISTDSKAIPSGRIQHGAVPW